MIERQPDELNLIVGIFAIVIGVLAIAHFILRLLF